MDLGFQLTGALLLCVDNTAAIDVANNMGVTARTKHFEMCIHYFRDLVQDKKITAEHILAAFQRADGFTKGLDKTKYLDWVKLLYSIYKGV